MPPQLARSALACIALMLPAARPMAAAECAFIVSTGRRVVTVFELDTQQVTAMIPVGSDPEGIAVSPDRRTAYVTNAGDNTVSVIDLEAGVSVATIAVGMSPSAVAVHPAGDRLYVCERNSERLSVVDLANRQVVRNIPVGSGPTAVALRDDGLRAYVVNFRSSTVSVVDLAGGRVVNTIAVGEQPFAAALSTDESRLYVTNTVSETLSIIATDTERVVETIPLGGFPSDVTVHPDGTRVYVARAFPNGDVAVIDAATSALRTIPVEAGAELSAIDVSSDGTTLLVPEFIFANLYLIDTVQERLVGFEPIGGAGTNPQELTTAVLPGACPRPPTPRLAEDVTADAEEMRVDRPDALPIGGTLWIEDELVTYRSVVLDRLREVTRGARGTTPAAHPAGTLVHLVGLPPDANCDGVAGAADLVDIIRQLGDGDPGPCGGDVDRDGAVTDVDLQHTVEILYDRSSR